MDIDKFEIATTTAVAPDPDPEPANAPPMVVSPLTGQELDEGESKTIDIVHLFRDPDLDPLTYEIRGNPGFLTLEGTVLTAAPGFDDAGVYEVDVFAFDGQAFSDAAQITYEVANVAPPNRAPEVLGDGTLTAQTTAEGAARSFFITTFFSDPDGDQLTYRIEGPDFVGFSGEGILRIAPEDGDDGDYVVRVFASDGELESDQLVFDLFVPDAIQQDLDPEPEPSTDAAVRFEAGADALTAGADGSYAWGAGVALTGYRRDGDLAEVVFSTQFSDHGFGVAGDSRYWENSADFNLMALEFLL